MMAPVRPNAQAGTRAQEQNNAAHALLHYFFPNDPTLYGTAKLPIQMQSLLPGVSGIRNSTCMYQDL